MKKSFLGLLAVLPLVLAPVALAESDGHWHQNPPAGESSGPRAEVVGTIVSVDSASGSFVADAAVVQPPAPQDGNGGDEQGGGETHNPSGGDGGGYSDPLSHQGEGSGSPRSGHHDEGDVSGSPTTGPVSRVTITPDSSTRMRLGDHQAALSDLAAGEHFVALFNGSSSDSLQTLTAQAPVAVLVRAASQHRSLYAFVGSVTGVDPTAGTVTVSVTRSLPAGLVPAGSSPVTFTVGPQTRILGGANHHSTLSDVSVGDVVAGGLVGAPGLTLAQVSTQPLQVLLDLPASSSSTPTSSSVKHRRAAAWKRALAALDVKAGHGTTAKPHKHSGANHGSKGRGRHGKGHRTAHAHHG